MRVRLGACHRRRRSLVRLSHVKAWCECVFRRRRRQLAAQKLFLRSKKRRLSVCWDQFREEVSVQHGQRMKDKAAARFYVRGRTARLKRAALEIWLLIVTKHRRIRNFVTKIVCRSELCLLDNCFEAWWVSSRTGKTKQLRIARAVCKAEARHEKCRLTHLRSALASWDTALHLQITTRTRLFIASRAAERLQVRVFADCVRRVHRGWQTHARRRRHVERQVRAEFCTRVLVLECELI